MPATQKHIATNLERMKDDESLMELWTQAISNTQAGDTELDPETDTVPIWKEFVKLADKKKIADRIPGTVGKEYAKKYGKVKPRSRGQKTAIKLSPTAERALEAYAKPSDHFKVEKDSAAAAVAQLVYTNQRAAEKNIEALIKRSRADIVRTAKESANLRNALTAVEKKIQLLAG